MNIRIGQAWSALNKMMKVWKSNLKNQLKATTYVDQLRNDTGLRIAELKSNMGNRKEWMKLVNGVRVRSK